MSAGLQKDLHGLGCPGVFFIIDEEQIKLEVLLEKIVVCEKADLFCAGNEAER